MSTMLSVKGQVTIPKQIRDALGLKPGMPVDFAVNQEGEVVIHTAGGRVSENPIGSSLLVAKPTSNGARKT